MSSKEKPKVQIIESLKMHQTLVNLINNHTDKTGYCTLSQTDIAIQLGRSQTWVNQAIKRINAEKACIIFEKNHGYRLNYTDITAEGTFAEVLNLLHVFIEYPEILRKNEKDLAKELEIRRSTVQMTKAYYYDIVRQLQDSIPSLDNSLPPPI